MLHVSSCSRARYENRKSKRASYLICHCHISLRAVVSYFLCCEAKEIGNVCWQDIVTIVAVNVIVIFFYISNLIGSQYRISIANPPLIPPVNSFCFILFFLSVQRAGVLTMLDKESLFARYDCASFFQPSSLCFEETLFLLFDTLRQIFCKESPFRTCTFKCPIIRDISFESIVIYC